MGFEEGDELPSGEIDALAISGLPSNISRSISGGKPFCAGAVALSRKMHDTQSKTLVFKYVRGFLIISNELLVDVGSQY